MHIIEQAREGGYPVAAGPPVVEDHGRGGAVDDPAGYTAQDYIEHIRGEYSTYRWLFEPMLDAAGFDVVDVSYGGRLYGRYLCRKR